MTEEERKQAEQLADSYAASVMEGSFYACGDNEELISHVEHTTNAYRTGFVRGYAACAEMMRPKLERLRQAYNIEEMSCAEAFVLLEAERARSKKLIEALKHIIPHEVRVSTAEAAEIARVAIAEYEGK